MEYTEAQLAFFEDLITYLKALNDEVLTPEADQRARFLGGADQADFLRQMALQGKAFLTMPNGRRQYRKIETLKMRDVPDLMREIEYNNVHAGEHVEHKPLAGGLYSTKSTDPHTGRMTMDVTYSRDVEPTPERGATEGEILFYRIVQSWANLKDTRWQR